MMRRLMNIRAIMVMVVAYLISGSAFAISMNENVSSIPISEPAVMIFIGTGLIALSLFGRKKLQ